MVGFQSGGGASEQLEIIVSIVAGDQSGVEMLDQLAARTRQYDQTLKSLQQNSQKDASESFQTFADKGLLVRDRINDVIPRLTEMENITKNAKQSFQTFSNEGLIPATEQLNRHSQGLSRYLIDAGNAYGAVAGLQRGLESIGPQFKVVGENSQEVVFGLAGIARGGASAALGLANIATSAFATFTEAGRQAGEFYNQMVVGANIVGMNATQYATMSAAANIAGVSLTQLTVVSQRLTKTQEDLSNGVDNNATRALKGLDVQLKNTDGTLRDTYDVLQDVAGAIDRKGSATEKLAAVEQLFGLRGKEALALLEDLNKIVPVASELIDRHSSAYENIADKQRAFNIENERMKQNWNEFISGIGPAYTAMLKSINDQMDHLANNQIIGRNGPQLTDPFTGPGTGNANDVLVPIRHEDGSVTYVRRAGRTSGRPSEDDAANMNVPGLQPTGATSGLWGSPINEDAIARQTDEAERLRDESLSKNKTWNSILGRWENSTTGSGGSSSAFTISELGRSDAVANQFAGILDQLTQNMPKFNIDLQHMAQNVADWNIINGQYESRINDIKAQIQEQTALQQQLTLTGRQYQIVLDGAGNSHKVLSDEYQASQDKIAALRAAESMLTSERINNVLAFSDVVKMETAAVKELAKQAEEARKAYAPGLAGSVAAAGRVGGAFVTAIGPNGESIAAIVAGGSSTTGIGGRITSINGQPTSEGGPSLVGPASAAGAEGGTVEHTGWALIHKGERLTPEGQGGGNEFNFYIQTPDPRAAADWVMQGITQLGLTGRFNMVAPN